MNKIIVIINKPELTEPISHSLSIQKAEDPHREESRMIFRVQCSGHPKEKLNSSRMGRPFSGNALACLGSLSYGASKV